MNDILDEELNSAFVAPEREFIGEKLAPYTEGSRLLLSQIRDDNDSAAYFVWSFIFVHLQLAKDRKAAIRLCWDKEAFRDGLFEWTSQRTEKEREKATDLVGKILEEASAGKIEVVGTQTESALGKA